MRLHGRDNAIDLVRDFMDRSGGPPPAAVLVFTGPRGCGKTALLTTLAEEHLDQHVPYAFIDFAALEPGGIRGVLDRLVFELNRECAAYGRIAFPRYIVGRIVLSLDTAAADPAQVRARIDGVLRQHRPDQVLEPIIQDVVGTVLAAGNVPQALAQPVAAALLAGVTTWKGRRQNLAPGRDWYGHQDLGLGHDPLDDLALLNHRARNIDHGDNREQVERLLLAAFLADLRHGFTRTRYNCAVLLDNADEPLGRQFTRALVRLREQHAGNAPGDPDPMTVVATSRGSLVELLTGRAAEIPTIETASVADHRQRRARLHGDRRHWYLVRLTDLDRAHVQTMVDTWAPERGNPHHLALVVHGLTRGHPAAADILVHSFAAEPRNAIEPRERLRGRAPGDARGAETVLERLERALLGELTRSGPLVDDLVTCSPATDLNAAVRLITRGGLPGAADPEAVTRSGVWVPAGPGGTLVMLPVLRRILLERLAERGEGAPAGWEAVHTWLRRDAAERGDPAGELHHALALGDLQHVAGELTGRLRDTPVKDWLRLLRAVVAAPVAGPAGPPNEAIARLTAWADPTERPGSAVARLVAALWLATDPLTGARRAELHTIVRNEYVAVAPFSPDGLIRLYSEADRHLGLAELWR
ncbi:hypothetical protein GCM10023085_19570 [Actinomadura viridis]|uniref:DNA polymerase III delta prime subunit n=1 Tax=Actinomadura viridis TaxID=58110 RepID=A0A931GN97_9ACTN|nr:ATP-binding protein [Actinomadura viridis]MBG6089286.1 DNA polymerase III delta prime subunit [Actinomadura viridis]